MTKCFAVEFLSSKSTAWWRKNVNWVWTSSV